MRYNIFIYLLLIFLLIACSSYNLKEKRVKVKTDKLLKKVNELIEKHEYTKALFILNDIIKLDSKKVNAYILRAYIRELYTEYELAINDLHNAINIDPYSSIAYYNLGNLYFRKGDFTYAITLYSQSILTNPKFPAPYLNRANSFLKLENFEMALTDYKKYITMSDEQKEEITKMIDVLEEKIESLRN